MPMVVVTRATAHCAAAAAAAAAVTKDKNNNDDNNNNVDDNDNNNDYGPDNNPDDNEDYTEEDYEEEDYGLLDHAIGNHIDDNNDNDKDDNDDDHNDEKRLRWLNALMLLMSKQVILILMSKQVILILTPPTLMCPYLLMAAMWRTNTKLWRYSQHDDLVIIDIVHALKIMTESFCDAPCNNDKIPPMSWHGHDFSFHEVTSQVPHFEISDVAVEVQALENFPNFTVRHLLWCSHLGQEQVFFRTMSKKPK